MHTQKLFLFISLMLFSIWVVAQKVSFLPNVSQPDKYDFFEVKVKIPFNSTFNPFIEASLSGIFRHEDGSEIKVQGFCDAQNGTLFKIRFMPTKSGKYSYFLSFKGANNIQESYKNTFNVNNSKRRGIVKTDKYFPFHFVYEGSGEHFFYNSTTAYWLMGWKDENQIRKYIDRFASKGINRLRVALNARQDGGTRWYEPQIQERPNFTFKLTPWIAQHPDDLDKPDYDLTQFNLEHWQRYERMLLYAREKGIQISIIFYVDGQDHGCDPFRKNAGSDLEKMYYQYALNRFAAFDNVM